MVVGFGVGDQRVVGDLVLGGDFCVDVVEFVFFVEVGVLFLYGDYYVDWVV